MATPGAGTSLHIGMEQIAAMAGIQLTHVPFKGGAETNAAVLGGHTTLQADSTGWKPLVDAGQLRLLDDLDRRAQQELARRPDAQGARLSLRVRLAVRRRRAEGHGPRRSSQKLHDAFKKAIEDPAVIETLARYDMVPRYLEHRGLPQVRRSKSSRPSARRSRSSDWRRREYRRIGMNEAEYAKPDLRRNGTNRACVKLTTPSSGAACSGLASAAS